MPHATLMQADPTIPNYLTYTTSTLSPQAPAFVPNWDYQANATHHAPPVPYYRNLEPQYAAPHIPHSTGLSPWQYRAPSQTYSTGYGIASSTSTAPAGLTTPSLSQDMGRRSSKSPSNVSTFSHSRICCGKEFTTLTKWNHHTRYHNPSARDKPCSLCDKTFIFEKDLKRHVRSVHSKERHLLCNVIGCKYHTRGFARSDHLKRHLRTHRGASSSGVSVRQPSDAASSV